MANFELAFRQCLENEGGYVLSNTEADQGGETYAGIARNMHSEWPGWSLIDDGDRNSAKLHGLVKTFYKENFWDKVQGDDIQDQSIAITIFDFSVNAGIKTASILAQRAVGADADGSIGPKSLEKLNRVSGTAFLPMYAVLKIKHYCEICNHNAIQKKFLLGWINRALKYADLPK